MHVIKKENLNFLEVRQLVDHIGLFRHSMCLSSIKMISIINDKAYYEVEYMVTNDKEIA